MASGLARELRENCGYLRDAGWNNMASLIALAADELDRLEERVADLEQRINSQTPQGRLGHSSWLSRLRRARTWTPPKQK
jgi:hypothetical protein